ncbi:predicted protein [Naegleria gruberi]|uniref:Predicted protein n=1 Tax=Naegleria gruberi TaxID=5762 RepID=D2V0K6_NAEGR|nr:uncharacterized protein NAEGRDRAFT_56722 [Naegleria gruberi]EFC49738.1 predicted protein [Naegleria gruberi]|eukprot:XP_002682482.1 predicted protein [Naegleria gruberi strain NEG-M]
MKKLWVIGTQTIKTKLGKAEQTEDEEFSILSNKFKSAEKACENFVKHSNQLIENFHAFSTTLAFLAEDFRDVNTQGSARIEQAGMVLEKVSKSVETNCVLPFQSNVTQTVVNPANEYFVLFEPVKKIFKERKDLTLQYDYYRQQVEKLTEKQSKNPLELPKAKEKMNTFKEKWEEVNIMCKQHILEILEKEQSVYEPAIQQLCANLIEWNSALSQTMLELKNHSSTLIVSPVQSSSSSSTANSSAHIQPTSSQSKSRSASVMVSPNVSSSSSLSIPKQFDCEWFYVDSNVETQGPVSFKAMQQKFKSGEIQSGTHVYGGDLSDWVQIRTVAGLEAALKQ